MTAALFPDAPLTTVTVPRIEVGSSSVGAILIDFRTLAQALQSRLSDVEARATRSDLLGEGGRPLLRKVILFNIPPLAQVANRSEASSGIVPGR